MPQIHDACRGGTLADIHKACETTNKTNIKDQHDREPLLFSSELVETDDLTPLLVAVEAGRKDISEIVTLLAHYNLLKLNATTPDDEETALHIIARDYEQVAATRLIRLLINLGAEINKRDSSGRTAYDYASARRLSLAAQLLLDSSSAVCPVAIKECPVAIKERPAITRQLSTPREIRISTPGRLAIHLDKTNVLIDAIIDGQRKDILKNVGKSDLDHKDEHGSAAIHYTITHCPLNKIEILSFLLSAGAGVNNRNSNADTALLLAIKSMFIHDTDRMCEAIELLLRYNANPDLVNDDGDNAIQLAEKYHYYDVVRVIQDHLAQYDKTDQALMYVAIRSGTLTETNKLITSPQVNVNVPDKDGEFTLHLAVERRNLDERHKLIKLLAKEDVNLNCQRRADWSTALHVAVEMDDAKAVDLLTDFGASFAMRNMAGETPEEHATRLDRTVIRTILRQKRVSAAVKRLRDTSAFCTIL